MRVHVHGKRCNESSTIETIVRSVRRGLRRSFWRGQLSWEVRREKSTDTGTNLVMAMELL